MEMAVSSSSGRVPGPMNDIRDSIRALTSTADSGIIAIGDVRSKTNELIRKAGDESVQARIIQDVLEMTVNGTEIMNEVLTEVWAMMVDDGLWRALYPTRESALEALDTSQLRDLRKRAGGNRNRKEGYFKIVQAAWGEHVDHWNYANMGEHHLDYASRVASRFSYSEAMYLVNEMRKQRLLLGGSGRQASSGTIPRDYNEVSRLSNEDAENLLRLLKNDETNATDDEVDDDPSMTDDGNEVSDNGNDENGGGIVDNENDMEMDDGPSAEEESSDHDVVMESAEPKSVKSTTKSKPSKCRCRKLSHPFLKRLSRKNIKSAGLDSEQRRIAALGEMVKHGEGLEHVCFKHLKDFGAHFGLQVKALNATKLRYRLGAAWQQRRDLDSFKVNSITKNWWRRLSRPALEEDAHGVFAHRMERDSLTRALTVDRAQMIIEDIAGSDAWTTWSDTGNLIVKGMFSWLWDGLQTDGDFVEGVGDLIAEEFDMYRYHQAEINGVSNKGWLRTMYHSLSQQIIRQDLGYWLTYVCLRPDRNHRLIAYPYYAKYAIQGDSTFFRHVDMNVPKYIQNGHGGNIIQGSVSLDDETAEGCTEILPGFHHRIKEWWESVEERGHVTNGHVHSMEGLMLPEDEERYGNFVAVPCSRGDARITMPEIPHGSTAMSSDSLSRRTVLPWFVCVKPDGETLDNEESDKWSNLSLSYSRQTAPTRTPSGLHNKYGPIPYRFPASTQLFLSSPISQALVCRTTWEDPVVQGCANVMLGKDRSKAAAMLHTHRVEALKAFRRAWAYSKVAERNFYGVNSFFSRK